MNKLRLNVGELDTLGFKGYDHLEEVINNGQGVVFENSFGEVLKEINTIDEWNTYKEEKGIK